MFLWLNRPAGVSRRGDMVIAFFAEYLAYAIAAVFLLALAFAPALDNQPLTAFATVLAAALVSRFVVASGIRYFYQRPRPFLVHRVHNVLTEGSFSFPSGHSTFFFAFSSAVFFFERGLGEIFLISTVVLTTFRVIAGVHYPSDIAAGAAIGCLCGWLSFAYFMPFFHIIAGL